MAKDNKLDKNNNQVYDQLGNPAANVLAELKNLAGTLGLYTPARDFFLDWFHGSDTAFDTLTAGSANDGVWLDMSEINPDARSLVIINEDGATLDFDYVIKFSRDGLADDEYTVASNATNTATPLQVDLPASLGYDKFVQCEITPDAGQVGTKLNFKVYLVGRGG